MRARRRNEAKAKALAAKRTDFNRAVSKLVRMWMGAHGIKAVDLSAHLGVSKPTVSRLLRGFEVQSDGSTRLSEWSVPNLIALSDIMELEFPKFIEIACALESGKDSALALALMGTPPHSKERLSCILREASVCSDRGDDDPMKRGISLSIDDLPWKCPGFVSAYISGELPDGKASDIVFSCALTADTAEEAYDAINTEFQRYKSC